jgi:peroxiredoxin
MKRTLAALAAAASLAACQPAEALKLGAPAPDFTAQGALGGQPFSFHLADALQRGPVVVYFFPAAFTPGCTVETKMFADAADEFKAEGATLIGVTRGNVDQLKKFSTETCRSKFPVAAISADTMKAYDAGSMIPGWTNRTSYVIAKDGKVTLTYSAENPKEHVARTMAAVKALKAG